MMSEQPQVLVSSTPTLAGPEGIRFDFNEGCRVLLPPGNWRVRLTDLDTSNVLFDAPCSGGLVTSTKRYYVRFEIQVWREGVLVFTHEYNATDQEILVRMELGGLGDQIAWIGHAAAFAEQHGCRLTCCVRASLVPLLQPENPGLTIATTDAIDPGRFYATYKVFIFYNDVQLDWQPSDYRQVGICHSAAYILGLPPVERRPRITIDVGGPPVPDPYVCIAVQASGQSKYWNNPSGWSELVGFIKSRGFRVICIDQKPSNGQGLVWTHMPVGAEDQTGDRPLPERARWLRHATAFVGLSSGFSWLAWAAGCPVVMISGFTHPNNEFATPYRVINWNVCNSCSNDVRHQLDPADFLWCPRHKHTTRMFECTRSITTAHVIAAMKTVAGFGGTRPFPIVIEKYFSSF